ncbi:MAG: OsmC family protein [Pseudomonadota bacterium]
MTDTPEIRIRLEQESPYGFKVNFEGTDLEALHTDEPAPLGAGAGPNPSALLLSGIANCLSASLLFALRKFKNDPGPIRAEIVARRERNAEGRWRIPRAEVEIRLSDKAADLEHFDRVVAQFEQFCIVTQSVREGVEVAVRIVDADGVVREPGA